MGFAIRPSQQIQLSGDGTGLFAGRHGISTSVAWGVWTSARALGLGSLYVDHCIPDCASGRYTAYPGTIRGYDPRRGKFRRLAVSITVNGRRVVDKYSLRRVGGDPAWLGPAD